MQAQGSLADINARIASTRATIQAARDASAARIRDAQTAVAGYVAEHGLGAPLDIGSASFTGSLRATSGGMVSLDADVRFLGQDHTVHLAYDFNDLVAGARAIAHELVPSLPV